MAYEMKDIKYFRATFYDAACTESTIVIEFRAPFPVGEETDYKAIAIKEFIKLIGLGQIKVRDIEPMEVEHGN